MAPPEAEDKPAPKSAVPGREDNLTYVLAHLSAFDISPLHPKADLLKTTRDNVQLMVNQIFNLPREETDEGPTAVIPHEDGFRLPRQRPIPKVKPETRWEKFMKDRKMEKKKRSRLVYDEVSGDWRPRYGYKSVKQSEEKAHGILEVKSGQEGMDNLFDQRKAEQKLYSAKQKMREVRNRVEAAGGRLKASAPDLEKGLRTRGAAKRGADGLKEALKRAQVSSASFGKFDRIAKNEPTNLQPKRRKVSGMPSNLGDEKDRYMKAAGKVLSGESSGGVDHDKAVRAGRSEPQFKRKKEKRVKRRSKAGKHRRG